MTNRENKGIESASGWLMSQGARKLTQYPRLQARPKTVDHTLLHQHLQFHFLLGNLPFHKSDSEVTGNQSHVFASI